MNKQRKTALKLELDGLRALKRSLRANPPSLEELENRLRGRGDTDESQIQKRLNRVRWEMEQGKRYNHMVINDRVDDCVDTILKIIADACDEN